MDSVKFNYSKLRGKIVEKCGSVRKFSLIMGVSEVAVHKMLSGKSYWNNAKILKACSILEVDDPHEIHDLFFCSKSMEN